MNELLKTVDLSIGYEEKAVAGPFNFPIYQGEVLTLIGPNGAGKTTLLKTLAKQLAPVAGTVLLEEEDLNVTRPQELAKRMAVVFSDALRPEQMTCREAVAVGRYPYTGRFGRLSADDERIVDEAMEQVHVTELQDRPFTAVSDGQRQRVVLARALCQQPEIILLDEPTTFLDIRWKAEFLESLKKLSEEQGKTVLMTLHEPELARLVSDRVSCI
ncbi:MAG: ABC transporter ATP-binding protein, partial [Clostridia bacterium]|nr:ABC transporter ATP-binding protein [Clostridia bacterium]